MKRIITIGIICIFFVYGLAFLSALNILGLNRVPFFKDKLRQVRVYAALGALFTRDVTFANYTTSYRFYQKGKWQNWSSLEAQLFNAYIEKADFGALKHCRLDQRLSQRLYFDGYKANPKYFFESPSYKIFTAHLIKYHNHRQQPDSIEVVYKRENKRTKSYTALLLFKCEP